jgi:ribosomal protein S12 methylthiotransferase
MLMYRQTKGRDIYRLIEKMRKKIPGVAIRTSLIVGFPSETDREFKGLLKFVQEIKFERLGAFIYSQEEGTRAAHFKRQLPKAKKIERFNAIMSCQQKISSEINKRFLGKTVDVLIDEKESGSKLGSGIYLGRSQYDAPEVDGLVYVKSKTKLAPGNFVKAKITDTLEYDLVAKA